MGLSWIEKSFWVSDYVSDFDIIPFDERDVWLTSFWGYDPKNWGCIGFADSNRREKFISQTTSGALVCIYVTKAEGGIELGGRVAGVLEVSHSRGDLTEFISGTEQQKRASNLYTRNKWSFALKVTRAWEIVEEEKPLVEGIFPTTYKSSNAQYIGSNGVPIDDTEVSTLKKLTVREVQVYKGGRVSDSSVQTFENALKPSSAIMPATEPYFVGEIDGPKYIYILRLTGELSDWFSDSSMDLEDKELIKVGFSKSPRDRCRQIQSSYPKGQFTWEVLFPNPIPDVPPYANAITAIKGEDAMKAKLETLSEACSLGGEFYLIDKYSTRTVWNNGKAKADQYRDKKNIVFKAT